MQNYFEEIKTAWRYGGQVAFPQMCFDGHEKTSFTVGMTPAPQQCFTCAIAQSRVKNF